VRKRKGGVEFRKEESREGRSVERNVNRPRGAFEKPTEGLKTEKWCKPRETSHNIVKEREGRRVKLRRKWRHRVENARKVRGLVREKNPAF